MLEHLGDIKATDADKYNVCLINPALLPGWFWLPTAYGIQDKGHNYYIPDMHRGDASVTLENRVDCIEDVMGGMERQFVVMTSRGIEEGIRYIHRLAQQQKLGNLLGWMVISSVGPRVDGMDDIRHTQLYENGFYTNGKGQKVMKRKAAEDAMLQQILDRKFRGIILDNLVPDQPLSQAEVRSLPNTDEIGITPAWYIGDKDRVDNIALSAEVAVEKFGAIPTHTEWGHVGALSHTDEVVEAILYEAGSAYLQHGKVD